MRVRIEIEGEAAELAPVFLALALESDDALDMVTDNLADRLYARLRDRLQLSREDGAPAHIEESPAAPASSQDAPPTQELPADGTSAAALDAGSSPPSDGDTTGSGEARPVPPAGPAAAVPAKRGNGRRICPTCNRGWSSREHRAHAHGVALEDLPPRKPPEGPPGYEPPYLKGEEPPAPSVDARRASLIARGLICAVEGCGGRLLRDDDGPYCLAGHRPREAPPPEIMEELLSENVQRRREPSHAGVAL